ncbi:hypothetical protein IAT40_007170 [Kwoniella sp. CBS 6097]
MSGSNISLNFSGSKDDLDNEDLVEARGLGFNHGRSRTLPTPTDNYSSSFRPLTDEQELESKQANYFHPETSDTAPRPGPTPRPTIGHTKTRRSGVAIGVSAGLEMGRTSLESKRSFFSGVGRKAWQMVRRSTDPIAVMGSFASQSTRASASAGIGPQSRLIVASQDAGWNLVPVEGYEPEQDDEEDDDHGGGYDGDTRVGHGPQSHFNGFTTDRTGGLDRAIDRSFVVPSSSPVVHQYESDGYMSNPPFDPLQTDPKNECLVSYDLSVRLPPHPLVAEHSRRALGEGRGTSGAAAFQMGGSAVLVQAQSTSARTGQVGPGTEDEEEIDAEAEAEAETEYVRVEGRNPLRRGVFLPPPP